MMTIRLDKHLIVARNFAKAKHVLTLLTLLTPLILLTLIVARDFAKAKRVLPYPTLPYPTLSYPTLSYPTAPNPSTRNNHK